MFKMNKAVAVSVLAMSLLVPSIAEAKDVMPMQSKSSTMMDQGQMMNTNNLVPLRMFAETLGYTIMWNKADRSITLTYMGTDMDMDMTMDGAMGDGMTMGMDMDMDMTAQSDKMAMNAMYKIKLMFDSKSIMVGMDNKMMEHAPMLMDGKVYVSKDVVMKYLLAPFMMKSMS
ncbi:copper amine oxidase-like protein [Paenibacillus taihuensis]|uniref:Copper amine oxidase-like protein n=1 Tax=Paenibacillus taihuensis TaxID=1156355 RepID=A0A3D9SF01_9BACL|nr:stalk domain-containing protein [Paenibacillus taihuensis]REE88551.1 copper amine oxidase-like protein [Paenibacillus taihuensis]